jgi:hypothetical protein
MKHKHAEIIKAWADGAEIEVRTLCTHAGNSNEWRDTTDPFWNNNNLDFRIKPELKSDPVIVHNCGYGMGFVAPVLNLGGWE